MGSHELDEVDRQILHLLQQDARSTSTEAMGDEVGVAASTVRNRINRMEDAGVIRGYYPEIDYDAAGYSLHYRFLGYAPADRRAEVVERALGVSGVVRVGEFVDSELNLSVEVIAVNAEHLADIHDSLEACGLELERGEVYSRSHVQPFNHFGTDYQNDDAEDDN